MSVAIIKYNAGNIRSVLFALERLGVKAIVTDDEAEIRSASHVIFPGVGAAGSAMAYLRKHNLDKLIISLKQPFLGVCLGMQLMCTHSEENDTACLGIFDISVKRFPDSEIGSGGLKVPHMGWNSLYNLKSPLMANLQEEDYCYFVHSYYAEPSSFTVAASNYALPFSAALQKDNFFGLQFHPEKSATTGEKILKNFFAI